MAMTLLRRSRSVKMPATALLSIATTHDISSEAMISTASLTVTELAITATSEVIISDNPIIYPKVLEPDILVAMSQTALDKYLGDTKTNGTLFIDEELVTTLPENGFKIYKARFSEAATQKLGRSIVANMIMLGFLTSLTEITSDEAITESIRKGVPKGTEELNLKALELGREMANE